MREVNDYVQKLWLSRIRKKIQYKCKCQENECSCGVIEFDEEPKSTPYCCGVEMERIK